LICYDSFIGKHYVFIMCVLPSISSLCSISHKARLRGRCPPQKPLDGGNPGTFMCQDRGLEIYLYVKARQLRHAHAQVAILKSKHFCTFWKVSTFVRQGHLRTGTGEPYKREQQKRMVEHFPRTNRRTSLGGRDEAHQKSPDILLFIFQDSVDSGAVRCIRAQSNKKKQYSVSDSLSVTASEPVSFLGLFSTVHWGEDAPTVQQDCDISLLYF